MLTMPFDYFLILLALVLLYLGLHYEDYLISMLAGFLLIGLGIYIMPNGIDIFKNFVTDTAGLIILGVGSYVILRSSIDKIEANWR